MRSHGRSSRRARLRWLTGAAALLQGAVLAGPAVAQEVEYTGGLQTASGDYRGTGLSIGLGLGYSSGAYRSFTLGVSSGLTESAADLTSYVGWRVGLAKPAR